MQYTIEQYEDAVSTQKDLDAANKRIEELELQIMDLRTQLQDNINDIVEEKLTIDDNDCPCDGDCGCRGSDTDCCEDILP